jgi:hypothetical protein
VYLPQWSTSLSGHFNLGNGVSAYLAIIIFGTVLIVVMIVAPTGIQGGLRWIWGRASRRWPRVVTREAAPPSTLEPLSSRHFDDSDG